MSTKSVLLNISSTQLALPGTFTHGGVSEAGQFGEIRELTT